MVYIPDIKNFLKKRKNIKKNSPKYLICKSKTVGTAIKNKLSKKNKTDKKSFLKKFGEAKSLSDLTK